MSARKSRQIVVNHERFLQTACGRPLRRWLRNPRVIRHDLLRFGLLHSHRRTSSHTKLRYGDRRHSQVLGSPARSPSLLPTPA
jgi:hypothetical protein